MDNSTNIATSIILTVNISMHDGATMSNMMNIHISVSITIGINMITNIYTYIYMYEY